MALFTNLPVYKLGYDSLLEIHKTTKAFAREYKYTLGEKLKEESIYLLLQIYKANKSKKETRLYHLDAAREHLETIRLLWRICKDLKVISSKRFVSLNISIEELSKQLTAWQKYTVGAGK